MKSLIVLVSTLLSLNAFAGAAGNLSETRLANDATNLKLVSATAGQVIVSDTFVPNDSEEGYPGEVKYTWGPGLKVVVSYTAQDAFTDENAIGDNYPQYTNSGTQEFDFPGATRLVSAQLVSRQIQEQVVDNAHSVWCATNNDSGDKIDANCQDQVKYTNVTVNAKFLQIVTE